ncbi:MAG: AI-2E family transporter [Pseudonocardiales bacterium]|nr:AI-2E family transporter [Pseudonocardiales bacterium]
MSLSLTRSDDRHVPTALRVAAAIGWRLLVVAGAVAVVALVAVRLAGVVVPLAVALLLSALLTPAVRALHDRGTPRGLAVAVVMLGGLGLLVGVLTFVVMTLAQGVPELGSQLSASIGAVVTWLTDGPLHLGADQLRAMQDSALATLEAQRGAITDGAIAATASLGALVAEILLAVFALVFFLQGGAEIWQFLLRAVPSAVRTRADVAGRRSLAALAGYVRAAAVVAVVDAVAIGIALGVLGIPLAVPLAALVFLGAFVPIVGAVVAGSLAVLIALVSAGPVPALVLLAVIIAVMQLEGHVLQPLLLGRAVRLHPLAVAVAIAAGLLLAGIVGALLAVPLLAVVNSAVRSLRSPADEHVDPDEITTSEPAESGPDDPSLTRGPLTLGPVRQEQDA